MFGQSFAHPMYGAYSVPPAYVPSCDVFTPETSIENNTGDMFNIPVANKYWRCVYLFVLYGSLFINNVVSFSKVAQLTLPMEVLQINTIKPFAQTNQ